MINIRKVFLEQLPHKQGIGANINKVVIDWIKSTNYKVKFIYDDVEGSIEIKHYNTKNQQLTVSYNNKDFFIRISDFRQCGIAHIIGIRMTEHVYAIDSIVNGVTIIKYIRGNKNVKVYVYLCPICGYIGERSEANFKAGQGCAVCNGNKTVIKGINDIATTDPWMMEWLVNKEDSYVYKSQSHKEIYFKCPSCGCKKKRRIDHFYKERLGCCSDGLSYPNKFIFNILQQLSIKFKTEYNSKWTNSKRYDLHFLLNNVNYIIEANGEQHYEKSFYTTKKGRTLEEEQNNDKLKKELALKNGIKEENYIVIDCRKSELEFIKQNILNSNLAKIFDLSKIDWLKCHEFACSNRVKEACNLWNKYNFEFATDLGKYMNISGVTALKYLEMGNKLNWCNYDSEKASKNKYKRAIKANILANSKPVICLETKQIYVSAGDCSKQSLKDFGVIMNNGGISRVCREERKHHKGYTFKYIEDLTLEEYIKYDIENKLKELHYNT